jgi:hypothetical protein
MKSQSGSKKRFWRVALALIGFAALSLPCFANPSFPYHYHTEQNIDSHQDGYVDVTINADGSGMVTTKFSNGQQVRGNTFSSATGLYGSDGKPFLVIVETTGLDGSLGGRAREGSISQNVQLTPEQVKDFDHAGLIKMAALCDGIDLHCMSLDKVQKWLGPAITVIKTIYAGWSP